MKSIKSRIATFAVAAVLSLSFVLTARANGLIDAANAGLDSECGSYTGEQFRACAHGYIGGLMGAAQSSGYEADSATFHSPSFWPDCEANQGACTYWFEIKGDGVFYWDWLVSIYSLYSDP